MNPSNFSKKALNFGRRKEEPYRLTREGGAIGLEEIVEKKEDTMKVPEREMVQNWSHNQWKSC